jgi:hypothetical protein
MGTTVNVLVYVYLGLVVADLTSFVTGRRKLSEIFEMAGDAVFAVFVICLFLDRQWVPGALGVAIMILQAWRDRRKRKRRKAGEAAGAKSRARRDALVRRVRESLSPRPSRIPVPVREES